MFVCFKFSVDQKLLGKIPKMLKIGESWTVVEKNNILNTKQYLKTI